MNTETKQEMDGINGAIEKCAVENYRIRFEYNMRLVEETSKFPYDTEEAVFKEACPICGNIVRYNRSDTHWEFRCDTPDCFVSNFAGL